MTDDSLTKEIQDLIAVSYVMSCMLDKIAPETEEDIKAELTMFDPSSSTQSLTQSQIEPISLKEGDVASKMYDNTRLIYDTYIVKPSDAINIETFRDNVSISDSLDEFLRLEQQCSPRNIVQHSPSLQTSQTTWFPPGSNPAPISPETNADTTLSLNGKEKAEKVEVAVVVESSDAVASPKIAPTAEKVAPIQPETVQNMPDVTPIVTAPIPPMRNVAPMREERAESREQSLQPHLLIRTERSDRSMSVGARGLLMKLEVENEELTEQVLVLERLNERISNKLEALEEKYTKLTQERTVQEKSENEKATGYEILISTLKAEISARDKLLKVLAEERKSALTTVDELRAQLNDSETTTQLKTANESEMQEKINNLTAQLEVQEDVLQTVQKKFSALAEDEPNVAEMVIIKSYLHAEMTKRAISVVRDTFSSRGFRGDAAARHVSTTFDELYGPHWQVVLYRENGHGCYVYHNNNCYICFKLGNYHVVLFRY